MSWIHFEEKLVHKLDNSVAIKSVKDAISGDLNERYQEPSLTLLTNTAAFLDPRFKSLAHLSKENIDSVIKDVNRAEENDCETPEVSTVDVVDSSPSVVPPKKKKKIHPLKKMLGEKFGDSETTYLNCVST